jgi:predicted  nucleic acid-binding Zn-ribbon protein
MTVYHWGMLGLSILTGAITVALSMSAGRYTAKRALGAASEAQRDLHDCNRRISTQKNQIAEICSSLREMRVEIRFMGKSHEELKQELREQRTALDASMSEITGKLDRLFREGCARRCA